MSFISRVFGQKAAPYSMDDFNKSVRAWLGGGQTNSGVQVNEETAMRFTAVFTCVRVVAETMGSVPLILYKTRKDGIGKDRAKEHRLYHLLHDLPNPEMTSVTFREVMSANGELSGNAYAILTHNKRGDITEVYPVNWHKVRPKRNKDTGALEYEIIWNYDDYRKDGKSGTETLPAEKVLHIPGLGWDGLMGYSPIHMAREAVGIGLAATEFAARFYGQGMAIGGVLEHPNKLSPEAADRLKAEFNAKTGGLGNSHQVTVLEEGMKFSRIPMPFTDAQFVETQKLTERRVCGIFRVPPHLAGDLERATFSNIEHSSLDFITYSMLPRFRRFEQALNWKLLTPQERAQGYFIEHLITGLLRGDAKSRADALHVMRQDGIINADEWRELENMNPQEGGTGKVYLVNGNMISVETAAKQQPKNTQGGENE